MEDQIRINNHGCGSGLRLTGVDYEPREKKNGSDPQKTGPRPLNNIDLRLAAAAKSIIRIPPKCQDPDPKLS